MEHAISQSLRRHMAVALLAISLLVGGIIASAVFVEINGAVIAPGSVVVETNVKRVQHLEGGIVQQIHVREGQAVEAGDLLVRLDDTLTRAGLAVVVARLQELQAQEARLGAERDGRPTLTVPGALAAHQADPKVAAALDGQRNLLEARLASREGRKAQLAEQIKRFEERIAGLRTQRNAKSTEIQLVAKELEDLSGLLEKGLVQQSRITGLQRDMARLEGERGGFVSEMSQAAQAISERRIQILQIDEEMRAEVVEQLQAVRAEIAQLTEERVAAEEQLNRIDIRAPRTGFVHQLSVHTVGGVVAPGEDLMLIVPHEDVLLIEAQVAPTDIDQLAPAQAAMIRLPGFDQRTTPELRAQILTVSADLMQDPVTGESYYRARLALTEDELARLNGKTLLPGMPVEAFVHTGSRTILSYLVKPLSDHITHAFRDG